MNIICNGTRQSGITYEYFKHRLEEETEQYKQKIERLNNIIKEVKEYIVNNRDSDSFTELTSGKITDIAYCIPVFEDILEILDKGE